MDANDTGVLLGEQVFTLAEQRRFAAWSGDVNPMHVDPVAARRLLAGRAVVHGMHVALQLAERWAASGGAAATVLDCTFAQPVCVDDAVVYRARPREDGVLLAAEVDGNACASLWLPVASSGVAVADLPRDRFRRVEDLAAPLDEPAGSQANATFEMQLRPAAWTAAFPALVQWYGAAFVAGLAALSNFVGMVCPGLHSVFSSLRVAPGEPSEVLHLRVRRYDPRVRLYIVDFDGPVRGELRAFMRPPPQPQPDLAALREHVTPGRFAGRRVLVVGGSRGLGELTAKLLGAGGASVLVSYASGRDDARRVADELHAGGTACEALPLDLGGDRFEPPAVEGPLDAVFYFATPRIFRKTSGLFDADQFALFVRFYLERLCDLCRWLEARGEQGRRTVVYLPSTVFIDERPKGMTEYAMAKAAAEVLAADLNRQLQHVRVLWSRLPRLATDQTASILGVSVGSNVDALLPVVLQVAAAWSGEPPD